MVNAIKLYNSCKNSLGRYTYALSERLLVITIIITTINIIICITNYTVTVTILHSYGYQCNTNYTDHPNDYMQHKNSQITSKSLKSQKSIITMSDQDKYLKVLNR